MKTAGLLVLVATPIGNTGDISKRAIELLESADVVCCEDTRHSGRLFSLLGIRPKRLLSLHGHNEAERTGQVLSYLADGLTVALVSDAGMPGVSDPGARVVSAALDAGHPVSCVPGASAVTTAVALSGLLEDTFTFEGFLPRQKSARTARLAEISSRRHPSVVFEAPGRVAALLGELKVACGETRRVAVGRELTKLHEELWRGSLREAAEHFAGEKARGEFVVVLDGASKTAPVVDVDELVATVKELVSSGLTRRDAVDEAARLAGIARRLVYEAVNKATGTKGEEGGL